MHVPFEQVILILGLAYRDVLAHEPMHKSKMFIEALLVIF